MILMVTFSFFAYAEESFGLGQFKAAIKSLKLQKQHLNSKIASPDLVAKERDAISSRRVVVDSVTGFDDLISSIRVSQHVVSLSVKF